MQLIYLTPLSWGKLRKKPATKWFDKYFAPIPKFNQRFARQHDVGPPPQFLEASPDSGIAHHLSGTNSTNFAENLQKNRIPAECAGDFLHRPPFWYSLSLRIVWFATNILFILQDSLIRVTRRDEERKMLKEPTLVIVEHAAISLANQRTMLLSPNCQTKGAPRAPIRVAVSYPSAHASSLKAPRLQCTGVHPLWNPLSSRKKARCPFSPEASKPAPWLPFLPFGSLYASSGSFNLPFGILFNFPSQYFSSIGLHVIFRFSWNLPATLRWNHNQRDSKRREDLRAFASDKGVSPSMLQLSNWLSLALAPPDPFLERSIGLASVWSPNPFPLIFTLFVRHY